MKNFSDYRWNGPADRLARLVRICQELHQARELPHAGQLARRFQVDPRTVRRDLSFLRETLGAPIKYDQVRRIYRCEQPFYPVPELFVSELEVRSLSELLESETLDPTLRTFIQRLLSGVPKSFRQNHRKEDPCES